MTYMYDGHIFNRTRESAALVGTNTFAVQIWRACAAEKRNRSLDAFARSVMDDGRAKDWAVKERAV